MNNWGLVSAQFDTDTYEMNIIDMLVVTNLKKDMANNKRARKSFLDLERARDLSGHIHSFVNEHSPKFTMVEVPHGSQSASAMKGYGMCLGVLGSINVPMIQLSEQECKINALGKRTATKSEMINWAMEKYPVANWKMRKSKGQLVSVDGYNEHLADAVGALEAGVLSEDFLNAMSFINSMSA